MSGDITGVATAVPIFVGYTKTATSPATGASVSREAVPIDSFDAFEKTFGRNADSPGGDGSSFALATAIALYFQNGGGSCFVISVAATGAEGVSRASLEAGLEIAALTAGTILVVPDMCFLQGADYAAIAAMMLQQASTLADRMAILDLPGAADPDAWTADGLRRSVDEFEIALSSVPEGLSYGAVYAPAVRLPSGSVCVASSIAAGIWTANDAARGVWTAPANIAVIGAAGPTTRLSEVEIASFGAPAEGASINMLRSLPERGIILWGARTLDGPQSDFRYISVRRIETYIQRSIALALRSFARSPNRQETWAIVTALIETFLTAFWRAGGLVGTRQSDAFAVRCGLGTITADDLIAGNLNVIVMFAPVRPAEFVVIAIRQKLERPGDGDPPNP